MCERGVRRAEVSRLIGISESAISRMCHSDTFTEYKKKYCGRRPTKAKKVEQAVHQLSAIADCEKAPTLNTAQVQMDTLSTSNLLLSILKQIESINAQLNGGNALMNCLISKIDELLKALGVC